MFGSFAIASVAFSVHVFLLSRARDAVADSTRRRRKLAARRATASASTDCASLSGSRRVNFNLKLKTVSRGVRQCSVQCVTCVPVQ